MSINKLKQVRSDKWFKPTDLIVYSAILAVIVMLFIVFVFNKKTDPFQSVNVYFKNEIVFSYSFEDDEYKILNAENVELISDDENELKVLFYMQTQEKDRNVAVFDKKKKTVDVISADCWSQDCMRMHISCVSDIIYCSPHFFKFVPVGYQENGFGQDIIM